MKRILLILLAAGFWHSSAIAEDYYWRSTSSSYPSHQDIRSVRYPSAAAACSATAGNYNGGSNGWQVTGSSVSVITETNYSCTLNLRWPSNGNTTSAHYNIYRFGDSCASG